MYNAQATTAHINYYFYDKMIAVHALSEVVLCADREQRVTGTLVFILVGLSAFMAKVLKVGINTLYYSYIRKSDIYLYIDSSFITTFSTEDMHIHKTVYSFPASGTIVSIL